MLQGLSKTSRGFVRPVTSLLDCLKRGARHRRANKQVILTAHQIESLEQRALLAVTPSVTVAMPTDAFIGEDVDLQLAFDNLGINNETGYGPIIDVVIPVNGTDGAAGTDGPDGLNTTGAPAKYLGVDVTTIELVFPNDGGGSGTVQHPYFVDATGTPLDVTGTTGDKLVVIELPFGSFTPDQPAATVNLPLTMSNLADLNMPLAVTARAGFRYGANPLDDPATDTPLLSPGDAGADSSTWTTTADTNPILVRLQKQNLAPESETATGPNFVRQYEIVVEVAAGQTITDLDVTDLLPPELVYMGDATVNVVAGAGATLGAWSVDEAPPADFNTHAAPDNDLVVNIASILGGPDNAGFRLTFDFYVNEYNAGGGDVLSPATGDDFISQNEGFAIGDWTPIDVRDAGGVDNVVAHEVVAGTDDDLEDQSIAVQKGIAIAADNGAAGYTPGDVVEYTLEFQISDYFAFEDVFINDLLSDGQRLDESFVPTLFVSEHGNTSAAAAFSLVNLTVADNFSGLTDAGNAAGVPATHHVVDAAVPLGSQELRFRISDELTTRGGTFADGQLVGGAIPDGGTGGPAPPAAAPLPFGGTVGTIVYRTIIQDNFSDEFPSGDESVDQGDLLTNSAVIDGALLNVADLTPNGNREDDDTGASLEIARENVVKSIYAINGDTGYATPILVAPGDDVTYRFKLNVPSSDIEDLGFVDYLPLPVFTSTDVVGPFNTTSNAASPAAGSAKFGPDDTFYANSVVVLGGAGLVPGITSDADANSVTFTYGDFDDPANTATVIDILFTVTISDDPFADGLFLTNQVRQVETSTNQGDQFNDAIVQIQLGEPDLNITKGIVSTSNGSGVFGPVAVGPVAFGAPGTGDNIATTAEFAGTISSNGLAATPINSNLSGVDAGDLVKFAIVVENVGSSRLGAFDVQISDTLPTGFSTPGSGLNLSVTDGTGAAIGFTDLGGGLFGTGLELSDPGSTPAGLDGTDGGAIDEYDPVDGRNIVIITYDLVLNNTIEPDQALVNTAFVNNYAGANGAANHIPGGISDTARVTTATTTIAKSITGTNQAHTAGNNVAIGETVSYSVVVSLPEGRSTSATFVDTLDSGLAFLGTVGNVTITPSANVAFTGAATPTYSTVGAAPDGEGRRLTLDFGDVTVSPTTTAGGTGTITVTYDVVVINGGSNDRNDNRNNAVNLTWTEGSATRSAPNVTIVEPQLIVNKSIAPAGGDAGDPVNVTLTLQHHGNSNATAFDVNLSDTMPAGLANVQAIVVTPSGGVVGLVDNSAGDTIDIDATSIPVGETIVVTFTADLTSAVIPGTTVTNTANTDWTSLPGDVTLTQSIVNTRGVERTGVIADPGGTNNDHRASGSANVTIDSPAAVKAIVATSEAHTSEATVDTLVDPRPVAIGEIIRYRLQTSLPEGTSPGFQLVDVLPAGLSFFDPTQVFVSFTADLDMTEDAVLAGADNDAVPPTFLLPAVRIGTAGQTVTFDFGLLVNNDRDANDELITLEFNVLVDNSAANNDGTQHVNNFDVVINGSTVQTSNDVVSEVVEPEIVDTTKTVVGLTETTTTYRVTFSNTSAVTAWDVQLQDALPTPAVTLIPASVSINTAGGVTGPVNTSAGNTVGATFTSIPVGGSVTVEYTVTVNSPNASISNTANVTWTSLPVDGTGPNPTGSTPTPGNERTGAGGINDHSDSDVELIGAIGDRVWFDVNGNGSQDVGEPGIANVDVQLVWPGPDGLLATAGDNSVLNTTTNNDGVYTFGGLPAATYAVTVLPATLPSGIAQTFDLNGVGTPHTTTAALAAGQVRDDVDFGYEGTGEVGDTVFLDINDNDLPDAGEGITGVELTITGDIDGDTVDESFSTTTDASGNYLFNVPTADALGNPITYTVQVNTATLPTGVVQTVDPDAILNNTSTTTLSTVFTSDRTHDFGYRGPGAIGDTIFLDVNNNGLPDAGEGINGVTVILTGDFDGDTVDETVSTVTDADGNYLFSGLVTDDGFGVGVDYTVTVDTATLPFGVSNTVDPNGLFDDTSATTLTTAAPENLAQDFGYRGLGSIGDTVFLDLNGSLSFDAGEGLGGITVTLTGDFDGDLIGEVLTTTTAADGTYGFTGLVNDDGLGNGIDYTVDIVTASLPPGLSNVVDPNGDNNNTSDTTLTIVAPDDPTQDFGYSGAGSIGDTVFYDINGDGIQNGADPGFPNVAVFLDLDIDGDTVIDYSTATTTALDGTYSFDTLPPGEYTITIGQPGGTVQTYDLDGTLDHQSTQTLALNQIVETHDFGYTGDGSLGDRVWFDANSNGVQDAGEPGFPGVPVELDVDLNLDGNPEVTLTTVTNSNGMYGFSNLPAGDYTVRVTPPAGTVQTFDDEGSQSDSTSTDSLLPGENNTQEDFGYNGTGSIGNFVWFDANADGVQDAGEPGIPGVIVTLELDINGDTVTDYTDTTTTAADGSYRFTNLPPGNYTITATQPAGTTPTFDDEGAIDNRSTHSLLPGEDAEAEDFGYDGTGSIGNFVWLDLNSDGVQDADEPGLANVTVTLELDINGDTVTDYTEVTTTLADGSYLFENLVAGDYTITATQPVNTIHTFDNDNGTAAPNNQSLLTLAAGGINLDQDFGYVGPGVIGDLLFEDKDASGTYNAGDVGMSGVTVNLTGDIDGDGIDEAFTTMTTGVGAYSFTGLPVTDPLGNNITYTVAVDPTTLPPTFTQFVDPDATLDNTSMVTLSPVMPTNDAQDFGYVEQVDLSITKSNDDPYGLGLTGGTVTYTITVSNAGPGPAVNPQVIDTFPAPVIAATWSAVGTAGTVFSNSGTGDLNETVFIPVDGTITYTVIVTLNDTFVGQLDNTAQVTTAQFDTDLSNNQDTDTTEVAEMNLIPEGHAPSGGTQLLSNRGQSETAALVLFAVGTQPGTTFLPQYGVTLDIANAQVFAVGFICEDGAIQALNAVPPELEGQTLLYQAFEIQPDVKVSNVLPLTFTGALVNPAPPTGVSVDGGVLYVVGTGAADTIKVTQKGDKIKIDAAGSKSEFSAAAAGITQIEVRGDGGSDDITIKGKTSLPIRVYGGDGNDTITGGSGNDVLFGGAGNDVIDGKAGNDVVDGGAGNDVLSNSKGRDILRGGDDNDVITSKKGYDILLGDNGNDRLTGGKSASILIGGLGSDTLSGGKQDDLIIAGSTAHDADNAKLHGLLDEWASSHGYDSRTLNLIDGSGGGALNGPNYLQVAGPTQTVTGDGVANQITGDKGRDLFFMSLANDGVNDLDILEDVIGTLI